MALTKLNFSGQPSIPSASMPTDSVIQVKEGIFDTQTDVSSSYSNSGLSVSITPISTSSKIFVITNVHCFNNGVGFIGLKVRRDDTTDVVQNAYVSGYDDNHCSVSVLTTVDSPSTTNSITYRVQFKVTSGSGTYRINQGTGNGGSRITVMELGIKWLKHQK